MIRASDLVGGFDFIAFLNTAPGGFDFRQDFDGKAVNFTAVQDIENAGSAHVGWFGGSELVFGRNASDVEESITLDTDAARLTFSKSDVVKSVNNDAITPFGEKGGSHTVEVIDQTMVETAKAPVNSLPVAQNFKYLSQHTVIKTDADQVMKEGVLETEYHTKATTTLTAFKAVGGDVMFVQKSGESDYGDHSVWKQGYAGIAFDNPYAGSDDSSYHNLEHIYQQGSTDHFVIDGDLWYVGGKG